MDYLLVPVPRPGLAEEDTSKENYYPFTPMIVYWHDYLVHTAHFGLLLQLRLVEDFSPRRH